MSDGIAGAGPGCRLVGSWSASSLNTADDDGIKTSVATSTGAVSYSGSDLNGALVSSGALSGTTPRNVTVTLTSSTGSYVLNSKVRVTGKHWITGADITEILTITNANGGITLTGTVLFAAGQALTVAIEAQADLLGAFKIGCGTAKGLGNGRNVDWLRVTTAGTIYALLRRDVTQYYPDGSTQIAPIPLIVQADTDVPYSVASIHEGTVTAAFYGIEAGIGNY